MGTPKTATTAIQMFCEENRNELNRHGFEYPLPDVRFPHVNPRRNGHFLVARLYEDRFAERTDYSDKWWDTGITALHEAFDKFDNVILSDENTWTTSSRNTVWLERLLDDAKSAGYTVKIIVYLRRQDEYANSWLSQRIKVGYNGFTTTKWDEYLEKPSGTGYDYYSMLEKISAFTGRSNIIVRVYDRGRFKGCDGTIFSDFMDAIGLEYTDAYTISSSESNYSLTGNSQEIKRIMNIVAPEYNDFQKYLHYSFC